MKVGPIFNLLQKSLLIQFLMKFQNQMKIIFPSSKISAKSSLLCKCLSEVLYKLANEINWGEFI